MLTHQREHCAADEDGPAVDAKHHLVLVDLEFLEDAVLPLGCEAVADKIRRNEK